MRPVNVSSEPKNYITWQLFNAIFACIIYLTLSIRHLFRVWWELLLKLRWKPRFDNWQHRICPTAVFRLVVESLSTTLLTLYQFGGTRTTQAVHAVFFISLFFAVYTVKRKFNGKTVKKIRLAARAIIDDDEAETVSKTQVQILIPFILQIEVFTTAQWIALPGAAVRSYGNFGTSIFDQLCKQGNVLSSFINNIV